MQIISENLRVTNFTAALFGSLARHQVFAIQFQSEISEECQVR